MQMRLPIVLVAICLVAAVGKTAGEAGPGGLSDEAFFSRVNLVPWCIVPYDAKKRKPEERAAMLERLGFKHFAYDWRAEQLPTLEAELDALQRHHVELTAVWFPTNLNADARFILELLKKRGLKPQLWVSAGGTPLKNEPDAGKNVEAAAKMVRPIAEEAAKIGCNVALYNHGGWLGEPENELAVLKAVNLPNVMMVYNLNHGHEHVDRLKTVLEQIKPHLACLTLNGMVQNGDKIGKEVLPIGQGDLDLGLLKIIRDSGYRGRLAILNHTNEDAEGRLQDNLEGLQWLVAQLDGEPPGPKPKPRTYRPATQPSPAPATPAALAAANRSNYWSVEDAAARAALPMYKTIPAAAPSELTPSNGWPDKSEYADWYRSHGNDACTRYSPLDQINRGNVASLKLAWTYHSGDGKGNIQCNPVIVDGVIYAPTVGNCIVALDGETGHELWRFKCDGRPAHRGLTYHKGGVGVGGRLLFAAGKSLWTLDPKSGKPIDSFGDHGRIPITECVAAPAVYKNVIVYPGWYQDLFGCDLLTGKPIWIFHTIPSGTEYGADTWDKPETGANCWGGMALDASRGIAFITTGSPKSNFVGVGHHGDNLFGDCVVAIDALTGKRLWHFQEIHHDIWDLDLPAPPLLVTVNHSGQPVDAVAAVTKIGNTLLLDRVTGKSLFPFRLRRAPASSLPGEQTSPYQPDVELPEPFARRTFTKDDVTNISPQARRFILDKIADAKLGWFDAFDENRPTIMYGIHGGAEWTGACYDPATNLLYVTSNELPWMEKVFRSERPAVDETKLPPTPGRLVYQANCMPCHGPSREGLAVAPSLLGLPQRLKDDEVTSQLKTGKGLMPAFPTITDDQRKVLLDYLMDRDRPNVKPTARAERPSYLFAGYVRLLDKDNYPGCKPPWGLLNAIDLNTGKIAWRVPLGEYPELTARGISKTGTENFGGAICTAGGLVFCGGTRDIKIRAFDKSTGDELWSHDLPFGGFAPPATYQAHGKQYVLIPATGGGKLATPMGDAYVAFALP